MTTSEFVSGGAAEAKFGDAVEPRVPLRLYTLKDDNTFLVADAFGDVVGDVDGLFHNDTRALSRFCLTVGDKPPSLLSASVSGDNVFFTSHMNNRPLPLLGGQSTPEGVIHLERARFLWRERLYERVRCVNYGDRQASIPLSFSLGSDFRDMFEVRGSARPARGRMFAPELDKCGLSFRYEGLDGLLRCTVITFSQRPAKLTPDSAHFVMTLPANGRQEMYIEIGPQGPLQPCRAAFRTAAAHARWTMRARRRRGARLRSPGRLFNGWLEKSRADLDVLTSELPTGPYPYAGIPWFSTPFGRDAIVTALQTLWIDPALARGVLTFLASHQAMESSTFQDSKPGKIMHETRKGEMNALRELPFGQYYGGVDTTPLFVLLAGAYAERTGDNAFIDELWPALRAAMAWIEDSGDSDGDGLIDYARGEELGLANQGWKDSHDSVFHANGAFPNGPIAVVEVQGYAFAAYRAMAQLAEHRGEHDLAHAWRARAEALRAIVEARYWMEDVGSYGIAIDGAGALCRVSASNAGHLLFAGLPSPARAARVANELLSLRFNSGWGIRTLPTGEARFNPMSYHNGSVWPHDTALCAAGLARYGQRDGVVRLFAQMFEAAAHFGMRLPELFCGFPRAAGESPIAYPVACLPQAWAAGSIFMLLQACLGVTIDGRRGEIHIDRPHLPVGIDRLTIHGLAVAGIHVHLVFQRVGARVVAFSDERFRGGVPIITRE